MLLLLHRVIFTRCRLQLIAELSDTVAVCLLDLTDLSSGLKFEGGSASDIFIQQIMSETSLSSGPFHDLEKSLRKAIAGSDEKAIQDLVHWSEILAQQHGGKTNVTRILWKAVIDAPPKLADLMLSCLSAPFDFSFIDDINGRTCLHEVAIAGTLRLVNICLERGVQTDKVDVYGRSAMHYACMHGHADVCRRLVEAKLPLSTLDMDNYSPLIYATLNGSVECVRVLLDQGNVSVHSLQPFGDLVPLSLASQRGHVDIALLLLQHGAHSIPNSNGEYPLHLAAREGHDDVCKLLVDQEGWDTPDKYHEWTPLFHAACHGHAKCIQVLLQAKCRVNLLDEFGLVAVHYAAWHGHHDCVRLLLEAAADLPAINNTRITETSPMSFTDRSLSMEIDHIPSLSLPPPIMPHRVYGHNYLDKNHLVQVSIGHPSKQHRDSLPPKPAVRLHHRLINPSSRDHYLLATAPLKLVMTTSPDVNSAAYSISLPQRDEDGFFSFQVPSPDKLSLEFSIYPNFGTKTIGRAVAHPSLFLEIQPATPFILPILDHRLHVIGEVSAISRSLQLN